MNMLIKLRTVILMVCYVTLCTAIIPLYAVAGSNDLVVSRITRLTHPAYSINNLWKGTSNPFNQDNTKILIYEVSSFTHPVYGEKGRGLVWGNISDLIDAAAIGTIDAYKNATHEIKGPWCYGSCFDWGNAAFIKWSPLQGEEDVLYGIWRGTNKIMKINVVTGAYEIVGDYYNELSSATNPELLDWTSDNRLIFNYYQNKWNSGGFLLNVETGSKSYYSGFPSKCSSEGWLRGYAHHVHEARSPNKLFIASYHGFDNGIVDNIADGVCLPTEGGGTGEDFYQHDWQDRGDLDYPLASQISHVNWGYSNEWLIGADVGQPNPNGHYAPYIAEHKLWQILFDPQRHTFSHNLIASLPSAGMWDFGTPGVKEKNYGGLMTPTMSTDGKMIIIQSTGGKYSHEDYNCCEGHCSSGPSVPLSEATCNDVRNNWDTIGIFLIDVTSGTSNICSSFTYSDWGECQPNDTQTRSVLSSFPSGCTGGNPVLSQSCTYTVGAIQNSLFKASSSPVIDGNLGEYASANPVSFSPSSGGNTVTVRTLWDSEALYLGINVIDTQLNASVTTRDGSVWSEDSIEWFIDTYNDGGGSLNPDSVYMRPDDYQGIVNIVNTKYDSQGTASGTPTGTWNGTWQSAVKLSGTLNNNSDTDSGYTIEIKIPWTSIGYSSAPSVDTLTGMSFAVNDKDSSGIYSKMWLSNAGSNQNASNWQNVILSGTLVAVDSIPPGHPLALMIQ